MSRKVLVAEAVEERDFQLARIQRIISDTNFAKYVMKGDNPLRAYSNGQPQKQFVEVYDMIEDEIRKYQELCMAIFESDARAEVVIDDKSITRITAMGMLQELSKQNNLTHNLVQSVQEQLKVEGRSRFPEEINIALNTSLNDLQNQIKKLRIAIKISNATTFIEIKD